MRDRTRHPNIETLLQAVQSLGPGAPEGDDPPASRHPDLIKHLFVVARLDEHTAPFRLTGDALPALLGGEPDGMDFLDMWHPQDRLLCSGFLSAVIQEGRPGVLSGFGETLTGRRMTVEIVLAPLGKTAASQGRLLGLYQPLDSMDKLAGQPLWRHRLTHIDLPVPSPHLPAIRLVSSRA